MNTLMRALRWFFVGELRRNYHGNEVRGPSRFFELGVALTFLSIAVFTVAWLLLVFGVLSRFVGWLAGLA